MTMISSEKRLKELSARLNSSNPAIIIEAVEMLRNEDPFAGAIGLLAEMFDRSDSQAVRDKIRNFMNDLKESSVRAEVIGEILKAYKQSTKAMLVSSCWQSGLDYSPYVSELAAIFNEGDYITALECFTVIEESSHYLSRKIKDQVIMILKKNESANSRDKEALMAELVNILS